MNEFKVLKGRILNLQICIELSHIDKVLPLMNLETVPDAPSYLVGLMNLAGKSVPVIDLARRISMSRDQPYSLDVPILLCNHGEDTVGLIVDEVEGLVIVEENALQMRKEFNADQSPILGAINIEDELYLLLNLNAILKINYTLQKSDLILEDADIQKVRQLI